MMSLSFVYDNRHLKTWLTMFQTRTGGYVLSSSPGHFAWLFALQNELAKNHSISVVHVAYTLAPHGQYPSQLKEAAEALQWLIETEKKKPRDVSTLYFVVKANAN